MSLKINKSGDKNGLKQFYSWQMRLTVLSWGCGALPWCKPAVRECLEVAPHLTLERSSASQCLPIGWDLTTHMPKSWADTFNWMNMTFLRKTYNRFSGVEAVQGSGFCFWQNFQQFILRVRKSTFKIIFERKKKLYKEIILIQYCLPAVSTLSWCKKTAPNILIC